MMRQVSASMRRRFAERIVSRSRLTSTRGGIPGRTFTAGLVVAVFLCFSASAAGQNAEQSIARAKRLLREQPFGNVRDSVTRLAFTDVIPGLRYRQSQEMYLLGALLGEKAPEYFLGPLLRGYYLAEVSTDRRGHERAKRELQDALRLWPMELYEPTRNNLDETLADESASGLSDRQATFSYQLTKQYIQCLQQLADEHLELNEAREAFEALEQLLRAGYAADMHSRTKLAWMHYKYRAFPAGADYPFLKPTFNANLEEAIRLAREDQARVADYRARKLGTARYWNDQSDLDWYHDAATNIISLAYGVRWDTDSSIVYYEMMPEWMKIRNNGIFLYLADINYRMAERQFEYVGKVGNEPVAMVSQPSAIDAYVTVLQFKGTPEAAYAWVDDYTKKYQEQRGWGMICTAVTNYWNGHLDASRRNLRSASEYPEVFGNISLTRTNYDLVIESQRALTCEAMAARLDFEPAPGDGFFTRIWNAVKRFFAALWLRFEAFLARNAATDKYLQIRDRGEYLKPFYIEASGDPFQIWSVLRGLDPEWHLERLRATRDARPRAAKFRRYLEAMLLHEDGRDREALAILEANGAALRQQADTAYEKLFMAMTDNLHIDVLDELGMDTRARVVALYRIYPQTVSLWGRRLPIAFEREKSVLSSLNAEQKAFADAVLDVVGRCGFDFLDAPQPGFPRLRIEASTREGALVFRYAVELDGAPFASGEVRVSGGKGAPPPTPYQAAKRIAYGVFKIHERETGASVSGV